MTATPPTDAELDELEREWEGRIRASAAMWKEAGCPEPKNTTQFHRRTLTALRALRAALAAAEADTRRVDGVERHGIRMTRVDRGRWAARFHSPIDGWSEGRYGDTWRAAADAALAACEGEGE